MWHASRRTDTEQDGDEEWGNNVLKLFLLHKSALKHLEMERLQTEPSKVIEITFTPTPFSFSIQDIIRVGLSSPDSELMKNDPHGIFQLSITAVHIMTQAIFAVGRESLFISVPRST